MIMNGRTLGGLYSTNPGALCTLTTSHYISALMFTCFLIMICVTIKLMVNVKCNFAPIS